MKYTEIIDKYLTDEMTLQEATAFEQQVKTDPDLAHELKLQQLAIAGIQHDEEARFQEFKARMKAIENKDEKGEKPKTRMEVIENKGKKDEKPNRQIGRWIMGIAAGVLMLVAAYFLLRPASNPISLYAQKIAQIDNARNSDPSTPLTDFDRAKQLYKDKKQTEALQALTPISNNETSKYRYQATLLKADILYEQGNKNKAIEELRKITASDDVSLRDTAKKLIKRLEK